MASTIEYVPQPVTRFPDDLASREAAALVRNFAIHVDRYLKNLSDVTIPTVTTGGVTSTTLLDYLYNPGRTGGQDGIQSDSTAPFWRVTQHASATTSAAALIKLIGKNASTSGTTSGTLLRAATSDNVDIFTLGSDAATVINIPYTTYTSGNPIALTLQMNDATSSGSTFFRIRTNGSDVFRVDYYGGMQQVMTGDFVAQSITPFGGTSDQVQWKNSGGTTLARINASGAYGLVSGAAVGSVYTCANATTGIGAWTAIGSLTASFADNLFSIFDNTTPTKIAAFQLDGLSAGTHTYRPPPSTAATTITLAAIDLAQTFTKAQAITPDSDVVGLTLSIPSGNTTAAIFVNDVDSTVDVFSVTGLNDPLTGAPGVHAGTNFYVHTGNVGAAPYTLIQSGSTATRTFTLPNITGTALVRAGTADITQASAKASTALVAAAAVQTGDYQINTSLSCVGLGPTSAGSATVTITWRDENGDQTKTFAAFPLTALSTSGGGNTPQQQSLTIRAVKSRISAVSLTAGGSGYAVNDLVQITPVTGGTGAVIKVTALSGSAISTFTLQGAGANYSTGAGQASTKITGVGAGATFNITAVQAAANIAYSIAYVADGVYQFSGRVNAV